MSIHSSITVDHPAFRTALADLDRVCGRLDRTCRHAGREVDALLNGGWSGAAADAFAEGWTDWARGAAAVHDGLTTLRSLLEAVHRELSEADVGSQGALDRVAGAVVTGATR